MTSFFICLFFFKKTKQFFKKDYHVWFNIIVVIAVLLENKGVDTIFLNTFYQKITLLNTKNNTILLLVFVLLIGVNFYKKSKHRGSVLCVTVLTLFVINNEILLNYNIIYQLHNDFKENTPNLNLINGIMLIHPPILYISYALILAKILSAFLLKSKSSLKNKKHIMNVGVFNGFHKNNQLLLLLLLFSIELGCW